MSVWSIIMFVLGFVLLVAGAELLVRGAARLAAAVGISALVIGLTVVAFGTSAPELAVSLRSALTGSAGADIALGNVVGSNIFNILFILGLAALAAPLSISPQLLRFDLPVMIGASLLTFYFAADGRISRGDGLILFAGIVLYTWFSVWTSRKKEGGAAVDVPAVALNPASGRSARLTDLALIAGGLLLLAVGSHWLVNGAVVIARLLGLSELVISLTIIAAGTSLPEAATSVLASLRGQRDIAVGNAVGSNIFNLLSVLGLSSALGPAGISVAPSALAFDIPVMIAVALITFPVFFSGRVISRIEGLVFISFQAAYVGYMVLAATQHPLAALFGWLMLAAVIAATAYLLVWPTVREINGNRAARESA